jgi:hypothetical protein
MYLWHSSLITLIFFLSNNALGSSAFSDIPSKKHRSFKNNNYFIKPGYICRSTYVPDNHAHNGIDPAQEEVYQEAYAIARECGAQTIGDIGCGSAYKLLKYFSSYKTIGFEVDPNFAYLKSYYPERTWIYGNFNSTLDLPFFDVIICADVVEHLVNPDDLLNWIQRLNFKYLVISTPDRDKLPLYQIPPEQSQSGPPVNPYHIREWSFAEFEEYVSQFFEIKRHFHNNTEWMAQVIVATKKGQSS